MGEAVISKSPEQEEKESLVSAMAKDIKAEKERGIEQSPPLERTIVHAGIDFDRRCEEASARERDTMKVASSHGVWYHNLKQVQERRVTDNIEKPLLFLIIMGPVPKLLNPLPYLQVLYKAHQQFVVPAKKALTQVR